MSEQFIPELDCYPSDLLPEDIIDARDFFDDEEDLDPCEMGDHEFEFILFADGSVGEECVRCGAIDAWEA